MRIIRPATRPHDHDHRGRGWGDYLDGLTATSATPERPSATGTGTASEGSWRAMWRCSTTISRELLRSSPCPPIAWFLSGARSRRGALRLVRCSAMMAAAGAVDETAPMESPETRYARSGAINIAYQVVGEGEFDVVYVPGGVSNVALIWDTPREGPLLREISRFARVIVFDRRGMGMSDRPVGAPDLETRMDDLRAVMDAARSRRAAIFAIGQGCQ